MPPAGDFAACLAALVKGYPKWVDDFSNAFKAGLGLQSLAAPAASAASGPMALALGGATASPGLSLLRGTAKCLSLIFKPAGENVVDVIVLLEAAKTAAISLLAPLLDVMASTPDTALRSYASRALTLLVAGAPKGGQQALLPHSSKDIASVAILSLSHPLRAIQSPA